MTGASSGSGRRWQSLAGATLLFLAGVAAGGGLGQTEPRAVAQEPKDSIVAALASRSPTGGFDDNKRFVLELVKNNGDSWGAVTKSAVRASYTDLNGTETWTVKRVKRFNNNKGLWILFDSKKKPDQGTPKKTASTSSGDLMVTVSDSQSFQYQMSLVEVDDDPCQ